MNKAAIITEDGKTISQHFGRAPYYVVITVEDGKVINREMRDKLGHKNFQNEESHEEHNHNQPHGFDDGSRDKHVRMSDAIMDCQVLIAGGMGYGARKHMQDRGISIIMTNSGDIDTAVEKWLKGELKDQTELNH